MKLSISGNTLYADNLKVCFCEAGNERTSRNPLGRLLAMIQAKEDMGSSVTLEVA